MPPWRNWLARSAVNRKVGGSSPPGGDSFCHTVDNGKTYFKKIFDPGRTRTCNLLLRRQTRYPLRHWTGLTCSVGIVALGLVILAVLIFGEITNVCLEGKEFP